MLGNDAGTFVKMRNVALAPYDPDAAVAADFNGDGKLDLAVAETNSPHGQVSVEPGRGDGTFGKPIVSPLIDEGINNQDLMRTGDFNGDGKADLVIMDDYAAGFEVLLGKGDGTFQAPIDTTVVSNSMTFEVGDFNGDGKADLVVTTTTGINTSLNIYLSNGDGTFLQGAQYAANYGAAVVADVNHDGMLDLVVASFGSPLQVFLGSGGHFQESHLRTERHLQRRHGS